MPNSRTLLAHAPILAALLPSIAGCASHVEDESDSTLQSPLATPPVILPFNTALRASELGVVINMSDPVSVAIGEDYVVQRRIPASNVIRVAFAANRNTMPKDEFARIKAAVDQVTPAAVQAFALTWAQPYLVECVSITSAFAFGFDPKTCDNLPAQGAAYLNPYFGAGRVAPFDNSGIRPAMMLTGRTAEDGRVLTRRGIAADDSLPVGSAYLVKTTDSVRSWRFPDQVPGRQYNLPNQAIILPSVFDGSPLVGEQYINNGAGSSSGDYISYRPDVLFYFTGLTYVPNINTNRYLPGAMADHFTSYGGQLTDSSQMSILRWLEAGATASYGTAIEPYAINEKFPDVTRAIPAYFRGDTVIEAYWKSVKWPTQGVFVGEPLARPYGAAKAVLSGTTVLVGLSWMEPKKEYRLEGSYGANGPFVTVLDDLRVGKVQWTTLAVPNATHTYYRLVEKAVPGISNIVLRVGPTSIDATWTTAVPASTGSYRFVAGTTTDLRQSVGESVTAHQYTFFNLQPDTLNPIRLSSETAGGLLRQESKLFNVRTPPAGSPTQVIRGEDTVPTPMPPPLPRDRWYLRSSNSMGVPDVGTFSYGLSGRVPVAGRWTGASSHDGIGSFNRTFAIWYLRSETNDGPHDIPAFQYGPAGSIPVAGDWDGDGVSGIGAFVPETGTWYLRNSASKGAPDAGVVQYGGRNWIPVVGDWDGNGTVTIGVFNPATAMWYLRNSNTPGAPDIQPFQYGAPGDIPVAGNWARSSAFGVRGSGIGVFRPSDGSWWFRHSPLGGLTDIQFRYGDGKWSPIVGDWKGQGTKTVGVVEDLRGRP